MIGHSISGKSLDVIPVMFEKTDKNDKRKSSTHRTPKDQQNEIVQLKDFKYLKMKRPIGAHAQVDVGLSGACCFLFLDELIDGLGWHKVGSSDIRLQSPLRAEHINNCFIKMVPDVLSEMLGKPVEINFSGFANVMVSFKDKCYPPSHSDGAAVKDKKEKLNMFRFIWDFHPRGRILSLRTQKYGLFLENCGHHICTQVMCGNIPYKKNSKGVDVCLQHQGWDNRPREATCALVTIIMDINVSSVSDVTRQLLELCNDDVYKTRIQKELTRISTEKYHQLFGEDNFCMHDLGIKFAGHHKKLYNLFLNENISLDDCHGASKETWDYLTNLYDEYVVNQKLQEATSELERTAI